MNISVVIPTYQRRTRVLKAVHSVLDGARLPDEIIVVDDGSSDGTVEALSGLSSLIRVIRLDSNRGVASARNAGIRAARYEWIALLDSDDWWLPDHLQLLCREVENEAVSHQVIQTRERWYRKGKRVNPKRHHLPPTGDVFLPSLKLCLVSSSAVIFPRSLFWECGGYDERLPACEDYDLWLRMALLTSIGLVDCETIEKEGGRPDQLSNQFWGMDRFRVFAMVKLLLGGLPNERVEAVRTVCLDKLKILEAGAAKRDDERAVLGYSRWRSVVSSGASGADTLFDAHSFPDQLRDVELCWTDRAADPILGALLPLAVERT